MLSVIRTVVVDDSAFVRKVVQEMLARSPFIEVVGVARDGEEALKLVADLAPDVVTCDLVMPRMDGIEFVRRQMAVRPIPILVLTSSPDDCQGVIEALEAGAVDLVRKPTALANNSLLAIREELIDKVKAAVGVRWGRPVRGLTAPSGGLVVPNRNPSVDLVVIGLSTGGPQALRALLPQFKADFPAPIGIVLHMPVGYTAIFAEKLNELCPLKVKEASDGDVMVPGTAFLGQAGRHLRVRRNGAGSLVTELALEPVEKPHRPAVDVLFRSAAETCGSRVLAVVMTGMGDDGKDGATWVKAQGGRVLTEAEESCVVYGMPRAVHEAGLSDASYTLAWMAEGILRHL